MSTDAISTRSGDLEFSLGIPTRDTADGLFDEIDYQRACQAYLWAVPAVGTSGWQHANIHYGSTGGCDMVAYRDYAAVSGILTPNSTVAYVIAFPDLSVTGPVVWDIPPGPIGGILMSFWQEPVSDIGLAGPDRGEGAKYLIVGPGQQVPEDAADFRVLHSPSVMPFLGLRLLPPDTDAQKALLGEIRLYPHAERDNPPEQKRIWASGDTFYQAQPEGMAYWKRLDEVVQREVVIDRDRFFLAMLRPLGIEKGRPFLPDERQTRLLVEGARVGEAMAQATTFFKRFTECAYGPLRYRDDAHWHFTLPLNPVNQRAEHYDQLDERAAFFFEAISSSEAMLSMNPGVGSAYLSQYADSAGLPFDGGTTYRLHVPPNPPAAQFWELTCYDVTTRAFLANGGNSGVGSNNPGLVNNSDGSVYLYIGPEAPEGSEHNWIKTVSGKAWFAYFRLFGPTQPFFDRAWPLPDFEHLDH